MIEYRSRLGSTGLLIAITAAALVASTSVPAVARTAITECRGPTLSGGAELEGDLDCSVEGGLIHFRPSGKLFLNGFTMTGVSVSARPHPANPATDKDRPGGGLVVQGPGTIIDSSVWGTQSTRVRDVTITNGYVNGWRVRIKRVTLTAPDDECAIGGAVAARVRVVDSEIVGGACGIDSRFTVSLRRSVLRDSLGRGIFRPSFYLNVTDSTVSGHAGDGIAGNAISVRDSVISNNGGIGIISSNSNYGINAKLRVRGSTVADNGAGMFARDDVCVGCAPLRASVFSSTVTGNVLYGVQSERGSVKLRDATITGNGTDSECGVSVACADVIARELPSINRRSTCGTSSNTSVFPGTSWGVCALD